MRWTAVTGRSWLSPAQHQPPAAPSRPLPPVPGPNPLDELSPLQHEHELEHLDLLPDDTWSNHRPPVDLEPDDTDRLGERLRHGDTRWTLDLDDPYRWLEPDVDGVGLL